MKAQLAHDRILLMLPGCIFANIGGKTPNRERVTIECH